MVPNGAPYAFLTSPKVYRWFRRWLYVWYQALLPLLILFYAYQTIVWISEYNVAWTVFGALWTVFWLCAWNVGWNLYKTTRDLEKQHD